MGRRPARRCVSVRAPTRKTCSSIKDGITLKGEGPEKTVLEPPAQPRAFCPVLDIEPIGPETLGVNGICVADLDPQGKVLRRINDVRVTGFTVRDFSGVGILFGGTNRSRADHNLAASNKELRHHCLPLYTRPL